MDRAKLEQAVQMILEAIGEDPEREGLKRTPQRVAAMYKEYLRIQFTEDEHQEMVIVKDIPLQSVCEHHLLPFVGKAHIAYIPRNGVITGLSKFVRVVEGYAKRLQLQERLTTQIAEAVMEILNPLGVLVVIEAEHMCMTIRGVQKPGTLTVTSAVRGLFESSQRTRAEALSLIKL